MTNEYIEQALKQLVIHASGNDNAKFYPEAYIKELVGLISSILDAVEPEPRVVAPGFPLRVLEAEGWNDAITQYRNNRASIGLGKEEK